MLVLLILIHKFVKKNKELIIITTSLKYRPKNEEKLIFSLLVSVIISCSLFYSIKETSI